MIYYFDTLNSTNDYMYANLSQFEDADAILALNQTKGKGRGDHVWESDEMSFAYTVLKILPIPVPEASLMAGLAVTKTIAGTQLKWPNDIMIGKNKLGGILCRSIIQGEITKVIIGIGINVNESKEFFENRNLNTATSLAIENKKNYGKEFFYSLAENITKNINEVFKNKTWLEDYKDVCSTLNRYVKLNLDGRKVSGTAKDILSDGRMVLLCDDGEILNVYANNWEQE